MPGPFFFYKPLTQAAGIAATRGLVELTGCKQFV